MSKKKSLLTSILTTILSRGIGFIRTLVETTLLGLGSFSDSYMAAFRLTNFFRELFGEGAMSGAFIPIYSKVKHQEGEDSASSFFYLCCIFVFVLSSLIFISLNFFLSDILTIWLKDFSPEKIHNTKDLAQIMLPYLVFISMASMFLLYHQIKSKFFYSSIHPVLFSFSVISCGIINPLNQQAKSLALGLMIGGLLQLCLLLLSIKLPPFNIKNIVSKLPHLKKMSILLIPVIFSLMVSRINRLIDLNFASGLINGSLSSLVYATVLINVPLGFIGVATNNVIFPIIAKLKASDDHEKFQVEITDTFYYLSCIGLPVSIFLHLYSYEICSILFIKVPAFLSVNSMFDQKALELLSSSLQYYSPGLLALLVLPFIIKIFHACTDTKTPAFISLFIVIINVILNYYFTPLWQNKGIAAATSIASYIQVFFLYVFLTKRGVYLVSIKSILKLIQVFILCIILSFGCSKIPSQFSPIPELLLFTLSFTGFHLFSKKVK
ncbi:MAG: murein biosynthesis integral membrane protein MurJ [Candidatus Cloacimonetes bacterium]|nr:murein biosynthesis integral membrane protein MurJ [Candidatus Cloacimonadota bacterium]